MLVVVTTLGFQRAMTRKKKDIKKSDKGIFRIFELITESIGWLQIVASPLLIGLVIGAVIYFSDATTTKLFIGSNSDSWTNCWHH